MNILVTADENWGIGRGNDLVIRIPNDRKQFMEETTGKVLVFGRKSLAAFPQGMPLEKRVNIVLSSDPDFRVKGAVTVHSMEELLRELKQYSQEDIYVVGGESVYRQLLPYCNVAHVTKIGHVYDTDRFFPALDEDSQWEVTAESDEQVYFDITYYFLKYERKQAASLL